MNWPEDPLVPPGLWMKPKGLRFLLQERGLWREGLKLRYKIVGDCDQRRLEGCCAHTLMSIQEDFKLQKSLLQEAVESQGHLPLLFPKFHCELNWIEHFWGAAKWHTRKNCRYGIQDLRDRVPKGLIYAQDLIWKFWGRTQDIMQAYKDEIG